MSMLTRYDVTESCFVFEFRCLPEIVTQQAFERPASGGLHRIAQSAVASVNTSVTFIRLEHWTTHPSSPLLALPVAGLRCPGIQLSKP